MTYTPTKEELEEMGFVYEKNHWFYYGLLHCDVHISFRTVNHIQGHKMVYWWFNGGTIHPTSKQDIETLIRLFTK